MGCTKTLGAGFILLLFSLVGVRGQVLYSDGFEGYNNGALDANLSGGPNQGPNGGPGNPWFGPAPPNLQVVGTVGGVNPHSGIKMVTATAPSDFDQDWLNISARFNAGNPYLGNVSLDWWFYDPTGAGNSNFRDYAALGYYNSANGTGGLDYPTSSGGNLSPGGALQRLSLGASNPTGFDNTKYQARVVGATDGTASGQWFNVGARSIGWHEGKISLGVPNGANTIVSFYIDGVDVLDHAITTANGLNVIELNAGFGSTPGYYDDFTLAAIPEPGTGALLLLGGLGLLAIRRRK